MVSKHCSVHTTFSCITENDTGLDAGINVIPLPNYPNLSGWWYKPWVFSSELPLNGTILFLDLDLVIIKNINHLWDYEPNKLCIIRDFNRSNIRSWVRFNSSVFKFNKGQFTYVWDNLVKDFEQTKNMHGDQDWIYQQVKTNFAYWPDIWMQSYKWEIRNRNDIIGTGVNRVFKDIASPVIKPDTNILVFHGNPKPDQVSDPIVLQHWS